MTSPTAKTNKSSTITTAHRGIRPGGLPTMKKKNCFPHDFTARQDPKLQEVLIAHGATGIGVYWCIVEQLYEQGGELPLKLCKSIAFALHLHTNIVESIIKNFGLFENDGEVFWSNRIRIQLSRNQEVSQKRKEAIQKRWQSKPEQQPEQPKQQEQKQKQDPPKEEKQESKQMQFPLQSDPETPQQPETPKPSNRFIPPTVEEVQARIDEKGYSFEADEFINFYESKGWFIGKNKMKSWKAAMALWQCRRKRKSQQSSPRPTKTSISRNVNDEWK